MTDIHGRWTQRFAPLAEALAHSIEIGDDLGAGVAVTIEGELVAHIFGGWQDRQKQTPWAEQSLPCIFSSGKAVLAVLVARAVEQGLLDYEVPVADIWPEFGAAGKSEITVAMALSHQAGLCGLSEEMSPATWLDWDAICTKIAAQAPLWEPNA
ncbi:MAG: serine hydrolase domain-containing protein, partial [Parvularculaceae bacterium]